MSKSESKLAGSTSIRPCTCKNTFQDELYGPGNRVFNARGKGRGNTEISGFRCTSCSREVGG